ncbi:MAG: hypothetical protein HY761_10125 [Candidatus Omnitrophica bacterium]|nr:hypothetical protein [Candidatus Omnitrophota bacterium]
MYKQSGVEWLGDIPSGWEPILLQDVKQRIHSAQYEALRTVNKEIIGLYWDIGKMIVDRQKKHGWGKSIVETLAKDLQTEFSGMQGFSPQNLWYMRQFYDEYHKNANLQSLVGEISWTKHLIIMAKWAKMECCPHFPFHFPPFVTTNEKSSRFQMKGANYGNSK